MAISLDLGNSSKWELRYSNSVTAEPAIVPGNFKNIPPLVPGTQFESPILAVYATSTAAKTTWVTAGWIYQTVFIGITGNPQPNALVERRYRFYLDKFTLITFKDLTSNYALQLNIPTWIKQINVDVYEYTGEIVDTNEVKLDEIYASLQDCIANGGGGSGDGGGDGKATKSIVKSYFSGLL